MGQRHGLAIVGSCLDADQHYNEKCKQEPQAQAAESRVIPMNHPKAPSTWTIRPAGKAATGQPRQAETAFRSAVLILGLESIKSGIPAFADPGKLEDFLLQF